MSKKLKSSLLPKLRFSGFSNENWMQVNFGDIASVVTDYVANGSFQALRENVTVSDKKGAAYYVRLLDLRAGIGHKNQKYIDQASYLFLKKSALNPDDLLMANIGANVGEVWKMPLVDKPASLAPNMIMARFNDKTSGSYVYHFLGSYIGKKELAKAIGGGAHPKINKTDLKLVSVFLPENIHEQTKIADCLSSIDNIINIQIKKLEAIKAHKKGLMQQLFPDEGKTVPRLRFPKFQNQAEWKKKPFSKLFEIGGGKDHKHLSDGVVPAYGSGGYMRSVNEFLYNGESACIGRKGTINKPMFLSGKFWTVDTLFYTHSFKDCIPKFIFLLFQNINWLNLNEAGGVPSLSKVIINKVEVMIPSVDEQIAIVDCIFSVDDLIDKQSKKIEAINNHKKALMQQLLPNMEARTE